MTPTACRKARSPQAATRRAACGILAVALLLALPCSLRAEGDAERGARLARRLRQQKATILVRRGRQLLADRAYAEARDAFREALALDPDDAACGRLLEETEKALAAGREASTLAAARERKGAEERDFVVRLEMSLFEAQRALGDKQFQSAIAQARRVLSGAQYVRQATRAAALRSRAEKVLAEAQAGRRRQLAAQRAQSLQEAQQAAAAQRAQRSEERAAQLRSLREKGWAHVDAGEYDQALAVAEEMLGIDRDNKQALYLHNRARQKRLRSTTLRGTSKPRRRASDRLLAELDEELRDIPGKARVVLDGEPKQSGGTAPPVCPLEPWEQELRAKLDREVAMGFRDTPLQEAVEQLSAVGDVPVVVDPAVRDKKALVNIPESRMPLGVMLGWVARFGGLDYSLRHGAVYLSTPRGMLDEPVRRVYDISGFLALPEDAEPLPESGPVEAMQPRRQEEDSEEVDLDSVGEGWVELIRTTIRPSTWHQPAEGQVLQEQQPYTIRYRNGRIVVVHTLDVHEQIDELLNNFRKARSLQVHIVARFIELSKAFLDSIELDAEFDTVQQGYLGGGQVRRYRGSGTIGQDTNVGALSRFSGFTDTGGLDLRYSYLGDDALQLFLRAVIKRQNGTVLQAPRLTCFNTQRANIQVLTNHNYIRRVSTDNEPEIGNIPEGIVFDVQPFVSADRRYITLVLQPQMRTLRALDEFHFSTEPQTIDQGDVTVAVFQETYIQIPTTELRSLGTTVTVPNGGTLLLGGFTEVEETVGSSNIPFVEGIPLLGYILRGWDRREGRRSLVMLVTAQTVPDLFEE
ncbi:MAG: hypothetical protein ACOC8A_00955 [bacterium]